MLSGFGYLLHQEDIITVPIWLFILYYYKGPPELLGEVASSCSKGIF